MSKASKELKERIARVVRMLDQQEVLTLGFGHVSARDPESGNIFILGHVHEVGIPHEAVTADEIVTMDMEGNLLEGKMRPPGEKYIHSEIYKTRPDVNAVIHGHPMLSTAFSIAGCDIRPVYYQGVLFGEKVPVLDYSGQIDTPETGRMTAEALGKNLAVLVRAHGTVTVGTSVENAFVAALVLERLAKMQWIASQLGKPQVIGKDEIEGGFIRGLSPEEYFHDEWGYWSSKDELQKKHRG